MTTTATAMQRTALDELVRHCLATGEKKRTLADSVKIFLRTEGAAVGLNFGASIGAGMLGYSPFIVSTAGPIAEKGGFAFNILRETYAEYVSNRKRGMPAHLAKNLARKNMIRDAISIFSADLLFHDPGHIFFTYTLLQHGLPTAPATVIGYVAALALAAPFSALGERVADWTRARLRQYRDFRQAVHHGQGYNERKFHLEERVFTSTKEDAQKLINAAVILAGNNGFAFEGQSRAYSEVDTFYDTPNRDLLGKGNSLKLRKRTLPGGGSELRFYFDANLPGEGNAYKVRQRERRILQPTAVPDDLLRPEDLANHFSERVTEASRGQCVGAVLTAHNEKREYKLTANDAPRAGAPVQFMIVEDTSTLTNKAGKSVGPLYGFEIKLLHGRLADIEFIHNLIGIFGTGTGNNFFRTAKSKYELGMNLLESHD